MTFCKNRGSMRLSCTKPAPSTTTPALHLSLVSTGMVKKSSNFAAMGRLNMEWGIKTR